MQIGDIYTMPFGELEIEYIREDGDWVQLVPASGNTGWTWSGDPQDMAENGIFPATKRGSVPYAAIELLAALGTEDTVIRIAADNLRTALEQSGYGGI